MTWTPNDGPSREDLALWEARSFGHYQHLIHCALAAHDLYDENQRFRAERVQILGTPDAMQGRIATLLCDNARLRAELESHSVSSNGGLHTPPTPETPIAKE